MLGWPPLLQMKVQELEIQEKEVQQLQVWWGAGGLGHWGPEAEGSKAGGPGARALEKMDNSGALRFPRGVEKMGDLGILRGEWERSLPFHPQKPMNRFTGLFTKSFQIAIFECQGGIFEAEVLLWGDSMSKVREKRSTSKSGFWF